MKLRLSLLLLLAAIPATAQQPNWKLLAVDGVNVGMTAADLAITRHCISDGSCREANPILGQSLGQQLAVSGALAAGQIWVTHRWRKEGTKAWWVPCVSGASWHGVAIGLTLTR